MRVLHAAYASDPAAGVMRQMAVEQSAAQGLGLDWSVRFFVPAGTPGGERDVAVEGREPAANRLAFKREYYRWLTEAARNCDVLLLRYLRYDPLQLRFLARCDIPVFLVHHTLEGPQILQEGGRLARVKWHLDAILVKRCHALATGIVAVTEEIAAYERLRSGVDVPQLIYPNGIAYHGEPAALPLLAEEPPALLFVASRFVDWHGLDLVLESARRSSAPFTLHVVGEIDAAQRRAVEGDTRFCLHGLLSHTQVEQLAARCCVGLGSFALHRKDMHQACTLKVREYLVAGLPVYAGHADVFDEAFPYFRHGECELEPMIDFARRFSSVSRRDVAAAARPWIDKERLVAKLYGELGHQLGIQGGHAS